MNIVMKITNNIVSSLSATAPTPKKLSEQKSDFLSLLQSQNALALAATKNKFYDIEAGYNLLIKNNKLIDNLKKITLSEMLNAVKFLNHLKASISKIELENSDDELKHLTNALTAFLDKKLNKNKTAIKDISDSFTEADLQVLCTDFNNIDKDIDKEYAGVQKTLDAFIKKIKEKKITAIGKTSKVDNYKLVDGGSDMDDIQLKAEEFVFSNLLTDAEIKELAIAENKFTAINKYLTSDSEAQLLNQIYKKEAIVANGEEGFSKLAFFGTAVVTLLLGGLGGFFGNQAINTNKNDFSTDDTELEAATAA